MSSEVTLFDLPSKGRNACWSLNPWKTRLALNYKGIPYHTEWVEYPDIKPLFTSFHIPGNDMSVPGAVEHTIPAIKLPDGKYIMDSKPIIFELEKVYPSPSLHLENGYAERVQALIGKILPSLAPEAMPKVPKNLLNERSAVYFHETRAKRFGMPLPELEKSERAGETAFKGAGPGVDEVKAVLAEHPEGPYVAGKEISYADFILTGFWQFLKRIDEKGLFDEIMARYDGDGVLRKHYEACSKWLERDDH